jgi:hypothetical protein
MAVFGAAAALPAAANSADAELLELNAQIDRQWEITWDLKVRYWDAMHAANEEMDKTYKYQALCFSNLDVENEAFHRAFCATSEQVFALKSTSVAAFALKAKAAAMLHYKLWEEPPEEMGEGERTVRRLLEQLVAAAGLTLPTSLTES